MRPLNCSLTSIGREGFEGQPPLFKAILEKLREHFSSPTPLLPIIDVGYWEDELLWRRLEANIDHFELCVGKSTRCYCLCAEGRVRMKS